MINSGLGGSMIASRLEALCFLSMAAYWNLREKRLEKRETKKEIGWERVGNKEKWMGKGYFPRW